MPKFEFCIPTTGKVVPAGAEWFHEIKYDGYRLRVERDGGRVRLITRGGYDRIKRFPWIAEAALKNRRKQFVIDGEAVILGIDGIADFNALHSGKQNDQVQFCAFDVLAIEGEDVRDLPLKQELIERLQQEDIGPEERDEIGRLLDQINAALDSLDKAGPGTSV
jgi:bifunctional non-homologous end joining protein LigD